MGKSLMVTCTSGVCASLLLVAMLLLLLLLLLALLLFVVALMLAAGMMVVVAVATLITTTHRSSCHVSKISPRTQKKNFLHTTAKQSLNSFPLLICWLSRVDLKRFSMMNFPRTISSLISCFRAATENCDRKFNHARSSANNITA